MSSIDGKDLLEELREEYDIDEDNQETLWIRKANKERKIHGLTKEELAYDKSGNPLSDGQVFSPHSGNDGEVLSHSHQKPPKFLTPIEKDDGAGGFARMTEDERRQHALAHGTEVKYLACLMCGRNRSMKGKTRNGNYNGVFGHLNSESNTFEPYFDRILQTRKGGGRQIGFFLVDDETYDLEELSEADPELFGNIKSIAQQIVDECNKIEKKTSKT